MAGRIVPLDNWIRYHSAAMKILVIDRDEVRRLLPMEQCIEAMEGALRNLAQGEAQQPLRTICWLPGKKGGIGSMPAALGQPPAAGIKVVTVFPSNHGTEYDSHQGAVLLFEVEHGCLVAMAEAGEITAIRTAAVSAVATKLLARPEAGDLAIIGSGVQARTHLEALSLVRDLRRVRVWSPTPENRQAFAERESRRRGIRVESVESPGSAVEGADLICTCTFAKEPVLESGWISPGAHINAVGSSVASAREIDTQTLLKSRLFIDRRESAVNEAGDFLIPLREGAVDESHIQGEIGDLLIGKLQGRRSAQEITLFKSLGLGVEDVAAIHHIYTQAQEQGLGARVPFGGPISESD